ncbi:MAG: Gfo/Idh/MocA family oxidoreductase [Pirellulales bacterium]|nr:Gfo/Idh/MocA family oxidoreductase [Pirellulales bacterium]
MTNQSNNIQSVNTSRRNFLKAAAGSVFAVPVVWTGTSALGAEAKNDRIGVAAIGTSRYRPGTWGNPNEFDGRGTTIGRQAADFGNMRAVVDVNDRFSGFFSENYGNGCKTYRDYRHVLDRKDINAVTIGTPDHWHSKIAVDAMRAGKDVYCEKPLTLTIDEGKILCRVTKETGAVFQVGTQQRSEHDLVFLKAAAIVRSGRLGKKIKALSSVGQPDFLELKTGAGPFKTMAPPKELDWNMWLGQAPVVEYCPQRYCYDWRWWLAYSGGQVTDWGVHHTDIAVWAMGLDDTGPTHIEGKGTFPGVKDGYDVATSFDCNMKFADGQEIRLYSGKNELIFSGDKGRIRVNRGGLTGKPVEQLTKADNDELAGIMSKIYRGKQPGSHMKNFFDCIRDRSLPVANVYSHHRAVSCCHLANIALLLGRPLKWDPKKEDFIGDAEASKMLSRKQRKGFEIV